MRDRAAGAWDLWYLARFQRLQYLWLVSWAFDPGWVLAGFQPERLQPEDAACATCPSARRLIRRKGTAFAEFLLGLGKRLACSFCGCLYWQKDKARQSAAGEAKECQVAKLAAPDSFALPCFSLLCSRTPLRSLSKPRFPNPGPASVALGLGSSVAIDGDTMIAAALGGEIDGEVRLGKAQIHVRDQGGIWNVQANLIWPQGTAPAAFGPSVAIAGDLALIGVSSRVFVLRAKWFWMGFATDDLPAAERAARFWRFGGDFEPYDPCRRCRRERPRLRLRPHTDSTFALEATLEASSYGGEFGCSVALQGDTAVVGANLDLQEDSLTTRSGAAYVLRTGRHGLDSEVEN